jgi:hypothetical protein
MLFKNPVRTSKGTPYFTITKINWLTAIKEIIAVYSEIIGKLHSLSVYSTASLNIKVSGACSYHLAL